MTFMKDNCKNCSWYHENNGTCQLKKCSTGGYGYVTFMNRLSCEHSKNNKDK